MRPPRLTSVLSLISIAVIAVVGATQLVFGIARVSGPGHGVSVVMLIPDSANLVPRSPVLLSGIEVGRVTAVDNTADGVAVRFTLDPGRSVPAASTITIEALSALSEPYIEFRPPVPAGPALRNGQIIRANQVRNPQSIPELAHTVTTLLRQVDPQLIAAIIQNFAQALDGTDVVVPQLTHAADLLAATLVSRVPQLRSLLTDLQVPGPDVAVAGSEMASAAPQFATFGVKVHQIVDQLQVLLDARPVPQAYSQGEGLLPFLSQAIELVKRIGPDAQRLYPVLGPLLGHAGDGLRTVDLSALITQALNATDPSGAVLLEIHPR